MRFGGEQAKITYDLGNNMQLSSLTAYRRLNYQTNTYLDPSSAGVAKELQSEKDHQLSEELQLSSKTDSLQWLVGLYYFHEFDQGAQDTPFNNIAVGFPAPGTYVEGYFGGGWIKTNAYAAYGQATYEIVNDLHLTLGARYSDETKGDHDEQTFDVSTPYVPGYLPGLTTLDRSKTWDAFTPRVALDYQATPDMLLYVSWSKGFKSGTFNLGGLQPPVDPEKVSAFEAGVKSTWFDRRLRLNLAGFYYDYKDLQIGKVVGSSLVLENAASATIYGLESECWKRSSQRISMSTPTPPGCTRDLTTISAGIRRVPMAMAPQLTLRPARRRSTWPATPCRRRPISPPSWALNIMSRRISGHSRCAGRSPGQTGSTLPRSMWTL